MVRYSVVGAASGLALAITDAFIYANPIAQRLYAVFQPLARPAVDPVRGTLIDIAYGFIMAGLFTSLYAALPGGGVVKGLSFGAMVWFFRVVMSVAGQWVTLNLPGETLLYTAATGLVQMLLVGALYGITLRGPVAPAAR
jgi:hypothetical protein